MILTSMEMEDSRWLGRSIIGLTPIEKDDMVDGRTEIAEQTSPPPTFLQMKIPLALDCRLFVRESMHRAFS